MKFKVELTGKAIKDLKAFFLAARKIILEHSIELEKEPFPFKKKIKKIKGMKFPCYRLRIDLPNNSVKLFYGIDGNIVFVLRIVSKKNAEKILKNIGKIDFPPRSDNN